MIRALSNAGLLYVWERGRELAPAARAVLAIVTADPDVEPEIVWRWPLGERDRRLLDLHEANFGSALPSRTACERCHAELEFELNARALRAAGDTAATRESIVELDGIEATVRAPSSADLLALEQLDAGTDVEAALWERLVEPRDGSGTPLAVGQLAPDQRARIEAHIEALDPRADCVLDLHCRECGHDWTAPYDIARVLWLEIAAAAQTLLCHVHALAQAYGWSESEILSLSHRRRELYLALLD
jgi:hypothetical protein